MGGNVDFIFRPTKQKTIDELNFIVHKHFLGRTDEPVPDYMHDVEFEEYLIKFIESMQLLNMQFEEISYENGTKIYACTISDTSGLLMGFLSEARRYGDNRAIALMRTVQAIVMQKKGLNAFVEHLGKVRAKRAGWSNTETGMDELNNAETPELPPADAID